MYKVNCNRLVHQAFSGGYIGTPYKRLDCQAFIEKVLADCDVKNPETNKPYNWKGSNHMWRDAVTERTAITPDYDPPKGAWLFTIKNDGGEISRGYHDSMGNAAHIGLYLGNGMVMHSTTGGVQYDKLKSKRWTHWALAKTVSYVTPAGCMCENCINNGLCGGG